eukprot:gb/GECH01001829.1/.p1 GENE.gb/GECH01001829.1/~~gb/GECH01001829.1/.p1  ORF type:complete len:370 (+),score=87.99 gb/GECH01001829.1/:1-1110(+)
MFASTSESDDSPPILTRRLYESVVEVFGAKELEVKGKDDFGPFCSVKFDYPQCNPQVSKVVPYTVNPKWNQRFNFSPECIGNSLEIQVGYKDKLRREVIIGSLTIPLIHAKREPTWYKLTDDEGEQKGRICLRVGLRRLQRKQLMLHYNFEEDFMLIGRVIDRSGSNNDARLRNLDSADASRGQGVREDGHCIVFSGFNYIESRFNPTRNLREWTLSFWFKPKGSSEDYVLITTAKEEISQKDRDAEKTIGSGWRVSRDKTELWDIKGKSMLSKPIDHGNMFEPEIWNHLVVIYDGVHIKEYINGSLTFHVACNINPLSSGRSPQIGACDDTMDFTGFIGAMDEIRIYDHVLRDSQITELYSWGVGTLF